MNCLLVIDMQERFMESKEDLEGKIKTQIDVIKKFRAEDKPIFYTRFYKYGDIIKQIYPISDSEVIFKNCTDGFYDIHTKKYDTELKDKIRDYKELDIVGCNADICVKMTIDSAIRFEHKVLVYEDAILSQNSSKKAIQIFKFRYFLNPKVKIVKFNK